MTKSLEKAFLILTLIFVMTPINPASAETALSEQCTNDLTSKKTRILEAIPFKPESDILSQIPTKPYIEPFGSLLDSLYSIGYTDYGTDDPNSVTQNLDDILRANQRSQFTELIRALANSPEFKAEQAKSPRSTWMVDVFYDEFVPGKTSHNRWTDFHLDNAAMSSSHKLIESSIFDHADFFIINITDQRHQNPAPTQFIKSLPDPEILKGLISETGTLSDIFSNIGKFLDRRIPDFDSTLVIDCSPDQWIRLRELSFHRRQPALRPGQRLFVRVRLSEQ